MSRTRGALLAALSWAAILALAGEAHAYCRTKACDTDPSYGDVWDEAPQPTECVRNAQGCYTQGTPLYWPSTCLSFSVQRDGSKTSDISAETAETIIAGAFEKWASVDCGGGEHPSFRVVDDGSVACHKAEYNQVSGNANIFMFRDEDWPYKNALDTLALTTVTYNVETAEIYDADVEVNTADAPFTTTPEPPAGHADFDAVITHEVGHFLGLAHSEVNSATMRSIGYQLGTTGLRTLAADDVAGICEIYPPGERIGAKCEPRHGLSSACGDYDEDGCTFAAPRQHPRALTVACAALVGVSFVLRRLRQRGTS